MRSSHTTTTLLAWKYLSFCKDFQSTSATKMICTEAGNNFDYCSDSGVIKDNKSALVKD